MELTISSREMKSKVYQTNLKDPERALLNMINVRMTTRFALRGGFPEDPELCTQLKRIYNECPALFGNALTLSDRQQVNSEDHIANDPSQELYLRFGTDQGHENILVRCPIRWEMIRSIRHGINDGDYLPRWPKREASIRFLNSLRQAYQIDYNISGILSLRAHNSTLLQWAQQISFTNE
jgi:hypothetical protein